MTAPAPHVAVVGAGPSGLMAAEVAAAGGASVTVFDRMPSPGRKLLLAGRGGLNLTHSEALDRFMGRYGAAAPWLEPAIRRFGPNALRHWCAGLGIETFVGSSGRVFPDSFKTSPLLRAWLRRLDKTGVRFRFRHRWRGWDAAQRLRFETPEGAALVQADATILALGGASWPHLGSDGGWVETLRNEGLAVEPLAPANCGFRVDWSALFRDRFEGQPLKGVTLTFGSETARGDAIVTRAGLEGGPVYALAASLRDAIARAGAADLHIALKPAMPTATIAARLGRRRAKETLSNGLRKTLDLAPAAIGLLREAERVRGLTLADMNAGALALMINAVPLHLAAPMPIDRAISSAGGVRLAALGPDLMLRPGVFVAGEMVDWEAPTGGYLLQACFATGVVAGEGALTWLGRGVAKAPAKVEADAAIKSVI